MLRANDDRGFTKEYLRVCTMAWQEITTHVRRHRRYLCVTDQTYRHCVYVSCRYSAAYTRLLIAAFIHSFHLFEHDSSMIAACTLRHSDNADDVSLSYTASILYYTI